MAAAPAVAIGQQPFELAQQQLPNNHVAALRQVSREERAFRGMIRSIGRVERRQQ
jgi:hypothetical protein